MILNYNSIVESFNTLIRKYLNLRSNDMSEAIYRFVIEDFPAVVAVDSFGNDVYKFGAEKYRK